MSLETFYNLTKEKQNTIIQSGLKEFSSKSYREANTDTITKECGISKGILFHYFNSKKNFYLYILEQCVEILTKPEKAAEETGFYQVIFNSMDRKMELFKRYPLEIRFVNMAAKETNTQIAEEKNRLLAGYILKAKKDSVFVIQRAADMLKSKASINKEKIIKALSMYVNTIVMYYLELYKDKPEDFFNNAESIKAEVKEYIDFMLFGILKERNK